MTVKFEPSGSGTSRSFKVTSVSNKPVAVQINITARQVAVDGQETNPEADEDFLVYPPQILLKPNEEQTVRVTWLGDNNPKKELAYRIIAEELPINLDNEQKQQSQGGISVGIQTLVRYVGSIYITPKNAAPKLLIDGVKHQKGKNGADELVISFENQGTAHALLSGLNLHLTSQGKTINLKPEQLTGVAGENMLAGNKRQFVIPWPESLPIGSVTATFDLGG